MKLKEILERKAASKKIKPQEKELIQKLITKANDIIKLSSAQLGHVSDVFKEFDNHNKEHSEGVLGIIEDLLGAKAEQLSSHDLFALIAVSYLHDCGMAVSDYEMRVLEMVEGKLDGQKPKTTIEAKQMIRENLNTIYGQNCKDFNGSEIQNWIFVPADEDALVDYMAKLLTDYQDYRNGRIDEIKASEEASKAIEDPIKANDVKIKTNDMIRIDYLRITHHLRIEKYIKNWGKTKYLKDFPIVGMGQQIADDIAACCKAHGEDDSFLNHLKQKNYSDGESTNLQFVAMMLRLGDILHFSYDRAHPALRALHHFQSEYSYNQWRIKADNGLKFIIKNGKISCSAYCELARDYYDILHYVEAVDHELALYNTLSPKWKDFPKLSIKDKVNTDDLDYNKEKFQPVQNLKFTLDQNKVLELLTGAELYPNDYACLRELYQNSLDACRCQIAKDTAAGRPSTGHIVFGLGEEKRDGKNRKYVYCLDNGKGMTKGIIEKYLLHIGSSYYKSSDFFKKQAETGSTFTPTSQFGIGMLSCFMIGDEIEITTHEEGSEDGIISCVMEGPNEYFYYKLPSREDADKVPNSGTLVKVFLNEKFQKLLNDDPLEKLGYLLWYDRYRYIDEIEDDRKRWGHHLYQIMNDFIIVVPDGIDVNIELQNPAGGKESIKIYNKPLPIIEELRPYANINNEIKDDDIKSDFDKFKNVEYKVIRVQEKGLECRSVVDLTGDESGCFDVNGNNRSCVDGIGISPLERDESILYHLDRRAGTVNFIGEKRPQLSVSREEIIGSSLSDYDNDARTLLHKLIKESIKEVCAYLKGKGILSDNPFYHKIWQTLFYKFRFCYPILYQCLKEQTDCHDMQMPHIKNEMSFGDLLNADETIIPKDLLTSMSYYHLYRLLESESIEVKDENSLMAKGHVGIPAFVPYFKRFDDDFLVSHPSGYNNFWKEYDFVPFGFVRFISDHLWQNIKGRMKGKEDENEFVFTDCWIYSRRLYEIGYILYKFNDEINTRRRVNSLSDSFVFDLERDMSDIFYKAPNLDRQAKYLGLTTYTQDYSVLVVGVPESYSYELICFAQRGKHTRQELLDSITGEKRKRIKNVLFPNGDVLSPQPVK